MFERFGEMRLIVKADLMSHVGAGQSRFHQLHALLKTQAGQPGIRRHAGARFKMALQLCWREIAQGGQLL